MRAVILCLCGVTSWVMANEAVVVGAKATRQFAGDYVISVTVRHDDTGWKHYVDRWEVLDADGKVIATRTLHHPHENEQPFTRNLAGVTVPEGTTKVWIRAHDSQHGNSKLLYELSLPR